VTEQSSVIDVDPDAYQLRPYEWFSSQVAPVRPSVLQGKSKKAAYDAQGAVTQAQYHFLWPNFTININPGHPNLSIDVWLPDGPERTRGFSEHACPPDRGPSRGMRYRWPGPRYQVNLVAATESWIRDI